MKKFLLFLFLFFEIISFSQSVDKRQESKRHQKIIFTDSMVKKMQQLKDSLTATLPVTGNPTLHSDFSSNINSLINLQKEQREKRKKQAIIRIAIGLVLLALLIVGLRRRKK
jgi:hypothetical protein